MLAAAADSAGSALTGAITSNIFLSVIMGVSIKKIWLMITTLQVIVHMPLLTIFMPANAVMCFAAIVDISNMNIIPKDIMSAILSIFGSEKEEDEKPSGNF